MVEEAAEVAAVMEVAVVTEEVVEAAEAAAVEVVVGRELKWSESILGQIRACLGSSLDVHRLVKLCVFSIR